MAKRKGTALFMAFILLLGLTACGNNGGASSQTAAPSANGESKTETASDAPESDEGQGNALADIIPEQTVELTVYTQLANYSGEQIGWSAEILKERFNVKFNIINDPDGTFATRMASGNLGDIVIFGNDGDDYRSAAQAGMLYDWEEDDLVGEYGPYIDQTMQTALEKNRTISGTGKLYGFGHNISTSAKDHAAFIYHPDIRWDLYARLGYPPVNTLEDFVGVLEQMVALEPTSDTGGKTYGVSLFPDWDGNMVMFVKSTAALYGYDEFGFGLYDAKTQTFEDCLMEGGMYLRCLKFYNALYQKGLLDPDSMTQTSNDMNEDYASGAAFFNIFNFLGAPSYNTPAHLNEGKAMLPLAAKDQKNIAYGLNIYGGNRVWTIGAKTDYPELCMAIINWLATPEGTMTNLYGPQGLTWDYDDNGNPFMTELGIACQQDRETQITYGNYSGTYKDGSFQHNNTIWDTDAVNPETNGETYNWRFWKSTEDLLPVSDIEKQWREHIGYANDVAYLDGEGHVSVSIASQYAEGAKTPELNTTWEQVKECIRAGSWSAIYASSDAEFDAIVADMRTKAVSYGYEECVEWSKNEAAIRKTLELEAAKE